MAKFAARSFVRLVQGKRMWASYAIVSGLVDASFFFCFFFVCVCVCVCVFVFFWCVFVAGVVSASASLD